LDKADKETYLKIDLCTGSLDNLIKIWVLEIHDTNEGSIIPIKSLDFHSESINALRSLNFDGHHMLIAVSKDKNISIWDWKCEKNEPIIDFNHAHKDTINDVIFLGKTIFATCSGDKEIKVWDLEKRADIKV
jgi:WD40 repeat protein